MRALVIHESLTGNTRRTAALVAAELRSHGWDATDCPAHTVDLAVLQESDVIIVGTWVDGLVLFAQRPGMAGKLSSIPLLAKKPTYVFMTYAINAGKALDKLTSLIEERDGDVRGGMLIRRDQIEDGAAELAAGVVAAFEATKS